MLHISHKDIKIKILSIIIPGMQTDNLHEFRYNIMLIHNAQLYGAVRTVRHICTIPGE